MDYPDGIYLIKSLNTHSRLLCFFRNGSRSAGLPITRPLKEIFTGYWAHIPISITEKDFKITHICPEDLIRGMVIVNPNMRGKDLLDQLNIDYTIRSR